MSEPASRGNCTDTKVQNFQAVLLFFQAASDQFATRPAEAKLKLDRAINKAAQAISKGRHAIQGLRLSRTETNSLAASLNTLGEELAAHQGNSPVVEVQVEGALRDLHPILRDDIFRIAGEALTPSCTRRPAGVKWISVMVPSGYAL